MMISLVRIKGSPPRTKRLPRPLPVTGRQKQTNKKKNGTRVVCNSSSSERHVFTESTPTDANPTYGSIYRGGSGRGEGRNTEPEPTQHHRSTGSEEKTPLAGEMHHGNTKHPYIRSYFQVKRFFVLFLFVFCIFFLS